MNDGAYTFPLSSGQQRLWLLQQIDPTSAAYHVAGAVELGGALSVDAMARALATVVARHEALRTCFVERDGTPVQIVTEHLDLPLPVTDLDEAQEAPGSLQRVLTTEVERPFDLTRAPCLRVRLFRLAPDRHVLLIVAHHLLVDGWSMGVLARELSACYDAYQQAAQPALPSLPIQYGDFAVWQQEFLSGERLGADLAYWTRQLAGSIPPLELPTDRPRPAVERYRGDRLMFALDRAVADSIRRVSHEEGVSVFMVALAAFQVLLMRYSGQHDICVGTPVAGRNREELEPLIGFFVNTLVLRTDLSGNPSFRDVLGRVRETALGAYAHEDVPFEKLVDALRPSRDPGRNPLFQVMLAFQPPQLVPIRLRGLEVTPIDLVPRVSQFDLTLYLQERPDGIAGWAEYSTDLFDRATIEQFVGHFRHLLGGLLAAPERPVADVPLLTTVERERIVAAWNPPPTPFPAALGVHELVEAQVVSTPEAVAAVFQNTAVSYRELNARANQLARYLRRTGVAHGDRVALCLERSEALPVVVLAVLKAGAAYVPLDPAYPAERLAFMLADADVRAVVADAETRGQIGVGPDVAVVDLTGDATALAAEDDVNLPAVAGPDDIAYVIYTSGSTGRPKGVEVPHRALVNVLTSVQREPGLEASDVLVAVTTLSFDIAGVDMWLPLVTGARMVIAPRETVADGAQLAALLERVGATMLQATPATWRLLLDAGWAGKKDLRIICTGEALPRDLANQLLVRGATVWNLYGPTETTIWSAVWQVERGDGPVLIGHPVANTQLHVLDERRQPVPVGVVGELYIGGTGVARGYRGRPELTAERFLPDPFASTPGARMYRTGDLARRQADGAVECLGRIDHQVKIRGYRIELGEIEQVLREQADVREAVVAATEVRPGDTRLVAYVVPGDAGAVDAARLRAQVGRVLPDYMVPAHYVELAALPLTPNGKIDRRALPTPDLQARPQAAYVPPEGEIETQVAAIWTEVLGVERIGRRDRFFDLGGHSLLAVRMASRIRGAFGMQLPLGAFFNDPTIAGVAVWLARSREAMPAAESTDRKGGSEIQALLEMHPEARYEPFQLTDVQEAYWIGRGSGFDIGNVATHVYIELEVTGFDIDQYERTWRRLIQRHDMLRAIVRPDGQQQVLEHTPAFTIARCDLRDQPDEAAEDAIAATRQEMSHQVRPTDRWPLFEIRTFALPGDRHRLHLSFDLLIADAWSFTVLQRDFNRLYADPALTLPPLGISFRDYVLAASRFRESAEYRRSLAYWDARLPTLPDRPDLPLAKNPDSIQRPRFSRRSATLDDRQWSALKKKAEEFGLTHTGLLLAAYADVLATWSRRSRFIINLTLFNRLPIHPQVDDVVGDFTSVTLLETDVLPNQTFSAMARTLLGQLWADLDHRSVSGVQVLRRLARDQRGRTSATAPVVFTSTIGYGDSQAAPTSPIGQTRVVYALSQTSQVWLDNMVSVQNGALVIDWDAVDGLFPPGMIDDMFASYVSQLRRLSQNDAAWIESRYERAGRLIPEWQTRERQSVNDTWQETSDELLHVLFEKQAERVPERTAVICEDVRLTYADLVLLSRGIGHRLRALGAEPNTLVAIVMAKGWEQVVAALGVLQSGAAYVPIDSNLPRERLLQLLADSGAKIVLTQPWLYETLAWPSDVQTVCVERTPGEQAGVGPLDPAQRPGDLAYVIYTSGSTGVPKGVMIDHRGAVNTVIDMNQRFGVRPDDRVLALSSLNFDLSVYDIFGMLAAGAAIVIPEASAVRDPARWAELMEREQVTIWNSVPALMEMLVEYRSGRSETLPASLRLVLMSGDWIPVTLPDQIRALSAGVQVMSLGGATEASIWSILHPIDHVDPAWKSIPYGRPMVNQTFHVLDESFEPCPVWVPGQLYIGGIGLARGYWRDEEKTTAKFIVHPHNGDRLYSTGDMGRYLPGGDIEFLGREDFQVKIRGYRIELGEVEAAFRQHPVVRSVVVTATGKTTAERRLLAYVVPERPAAPDDGTGSNTHGETIDRAGLEVSLQTFVADKLPEHMRPSRIVVLEELPLTPNGKVDYRSLPEPEAPLLASTATHAQPRTQTEVALVELWQEVLGAAGVGIHDSFFELGGDSVSAVRVASRASQKGYEMSPTMVFRHPTVAELASLIAEPSASVEDAEEIVL
jgi:amino acid adenylation domain-containing protein